MFFILFKLEHDRSILNRVRSMFFLFSPLPASVARHLYMRSPVGIGAVTRIYGGRQNNGTAPSHFCKGSRSIARKSLQALEGLKWVEKDPSGYVH